MNLDTLNDNETPPDTGDGSLTETLANPTDTDFVVDEPRNRLGSGTILLSALVLAAIGGTYFMYWRTGPQTAAAAVDPKAAAAHETINKFLSDGGKNIQQMQNMLKDTEKVVERFATYPATTQVPLEDLKTNPFRFAKPPELPTDEEAQKLRREEMRALAASEAAQLTIASIVVSGNRKAAVVNGTMVGEGDTVGDFVVEKIEAQSLVVRKDTFRFRLAMQR